MLKFQGARTFTSAERFLEKVRIEILESGSTYKVIAGRTGVATGTIQRLANGKTRWPRPTTLFPLLKAMGLQLQLVNGKSQLWDSGRNEEGD